jgi:hypothetical protein
VKRALVLLAHGLAIWAVCTAARAIALGVASESAALAVHAIAAPIVTAVVCAVYYGGFHYTSPLATSVGMAGVVICMDLAWALLVERSLDTFRSVVGTWLPLAFIFAQALASGVVDRRSRSGTAP